MVSRNWWWFIFHLLSINCWLVSRKYIKIHFKVEIDKENTELEWNFYFDAQNVKRLLTCTLHPITSQDVINVTISKQFQAHQTNYKLIYACNVWQVFMFAVCLTNIADVLEHVGFLNNRWWPHTIEQIFLGHFHCLFDNSLRKCSMEKVFIAIIANNPDESPSSGTPCGLFGAKIHIYYEHKWKFTLNTCWVWVWACM